MGNNVSARCVVFPHIRDESQHVFTCVLQHCKVKVKEGKTNMICDSPEVCFKKQDYQLNQAYFKKTGFNYSFFF